MKNDRKLIPVRLNKELIDGLSELAECNFRSLNGEIEYLITKELMQRGKNKVDGVSYFSAHSAFFWDDGNMCIDPVRFSDPIRLTDLKCYDKERAEIVDNTLAFLHGIPAQNILLYGDKGTGKSATVHAVLNEYAKSGLRLVELKKRDICSFPRLANILADAGKNYKFIVFIDDLSFVEGQDNFYELKSVLEGSIFQARNILIYATSNRRHLIKESFLERSNDMHLSDSMSEQISLSDRFGITVTFIKPDRNEFFDILCGILRDRKIAVDREQLERLGDAFSIEKGGRSPRAARQLADIIESKLKRGVELEA